MKTRPPYKEAYKKNKIDLHTRIELQNMILKNLGITIIISELL